MKPLPTSIAFWYHNLQAFVGYSRKSCKLYPTYFIISPSIYLIFPLFQGRLFSFFVSRGFRLERGGDGATAFMPQHQYQRRIQVVHSIFNAAEVVWGHYIASHADDEQIAEPLIKQQLSGNPRITAAEDGCKRVLLGEQLFSPSNAWMSVQGTAGNESFIPLHQTSDRFASVSGCRLFGLRLRAALSAWNFETAI